MSRSTSRTAHAGIAGGSARGSRRSIGPCGSGARANTSCKRRSPPCTSRPSDADATDWEQIAELYGALAKLTPSPVVELNRAAAVGFAVGPEAGLELLEPLLEIPRSSATSRCTPRTPSCSGAPAT